MSESEDRLCEGESALTLSRASHAGAEAMHEDRLSNGFANRPARGLRLTQRIWKIICMR